MTGSESEAVLLSHAHSNRANMGEISGENLIHICLHMNKVTQYPERLRFVSESYVPLTFKRQRDIRQKKFSVM